MEMMVRTRNIALVTGLRLTGLATTSAAAQQRQRGKNIKENVLHSYLCFHFQIWS